MALTRKFKDTVQARVQADPAFREAAPPVSAEKPDPHVRDRLAGIDVAASFC